MFLGIILLSTMFVGNNLNFVSAVAADLDAGKSWTYVGPQLPPAGGVAIPVSSLITGEDVIFFVTQEK
jgi:lipopolysaccharide export LptBFGC system permease protein LptF|tara:strand:- start:364 stop:567 length:204 start_codon:yes stop_codon:yes gene_type:complete